MSTNRGDAPIRPQAGGSLDPSEIIGRDALVQGAFQSLAREIPLLVTDPRRLGKTCFLDRLVFLTEEPWTTVKIDYEGVLTSDEFLRRTIESLRAHQRIRSRVAASVKAFMDNVDVVAGPVTVRATFQSRSRSDLLETTLSRIDDQLEADEKLVMALDEVPLAIENIVVREGSLAADGLLQSLRRLRQRRPSRIAWIVTGSVGFHHVLRMANTTEGAINDFESLPCGPLDPSWAAVLARKLLLGIEVEFDDEAVAALVEVSGGIPYLMHYLANTLRGIRGPCVAATVRDAWMGFVHDRDRSRAVTHFLTRIGGYYGEDEELACRILDTLAASSAPSSFEGVLAAVDLSGSTATDRDRGRRVLDDLVDDHYLIDTPDGIGWRYPVLREIWAVRRRLAA